MTPIMTEKEVNRISMLGLAHVGDGVYELLVRTWLCKNGHTAIHELHKLTVSYVKAPAQAAAVARISGALTAEETEVYKRGRNTKVHGIPKNAEISEYHAATGLEALFGWLWLLGRTDRINFLFDLIMEENDAS